MHRAMQNNWDCGGPPNTCAVGCCWGRDNCLLDCLVGLCGMCVPLCLAGNLPACIACAMVWCPIAFLNCWYNRCCDDYCRVCATSGGS